MKRDRHKELRELERNIHIHDRGVDDKETRTAAEWAQLQGRGFLCSTEW